ncbi:MAG TPA: DUF2180 family protein [Solirubrobacteraceae bacterium]|nr:DUF2180 family protein [Solirubrobacteraceae bacterium]
MRCYLCDSSGQPTEAVAICRVCGLALCRDHHDEALLADRPAGLVRPGCVHDPIRWARVRREIQKLEALL